MSRTNTAAYESIKASQIVFQNPDRSFPEPGAVLAIDNYKGATAWTRNLDIKSLTLSGAYSTGVLTYENQLLVNGAPVGGGGGSDISGGSNITVDISASVQVVSLDVREDIDMQSNSIVRCKSIELPRIPLVSSAKITFGDMSINKYGLISYEEGGRKLFVSADTNVEIRGISGSMVAGTNGIYTETTVNKSIRSVVKNGVGAKVSAMELNDTNTLTVGATDISSSYPTMAFQTDISRGSIVFNRNGEMRLSAGAYSMEAVPTGSFQNVLGYDVSSGEIRYQPASGGSELSGGYNISVDGGAINMDISQAVIMNNNPIVGASYVDISGDEDSVRLSYDAINIQGLSSSRSMRIYDSNLTNPTLKLSNKDGLRGGYLTYDSNQDLLTTSGAAVLLRATSVTGGSVTINSSETSINSRSKPIQLTVSTMGAPISEAMLTMQNELQIGDSAIATNPAIILQGSSTAARVEYDASGSLRFTAEGYVMDAVPAAPSSLPTVLGYDTSTGEIKSQPVGISPITQYVHDLTAGAIPITGSASLGTFTPTTSGIYLFTFSIALMNSVSIPIQFNNTFEAFRFDLKFVFTYTLARLSGIQNRANSATPTTDIYSTTVMEKLFAGTAYTIEATHDSTSLSPSTSSWASGQPRVRIAKLC